MSEPPPSGPAALARLGRLVRKELAESLRDRRTILTLLLMPLLLYPLLMLAFQQFLAATATAGDRPEYRLGFVSKEQEREGTQFLLAGEAELHRQQVFTRPATTGPATTRPSAHLFPQPVLQVAEPPTPDLEAEVLAGRIDVGLRANPARTNGPPAVYELQMVYREDSPRSADAVRYLKRLAAAGNKAYIDQWLKGQGVTAIDYVVVRPVAVASPPGKQSSVFTSLIPLVLVLMTITGAVYPAIDLTAGERERGTLEILVAAPIPRRSVLFAKYVAVVTVALLTALVNLGMMTATLLVTGLGPMVFGERGLTPLLFVQVLALLVLFAAFFSAVLLTVTSFARSFKEAQAYLIPLMLLALAPGLVSLMPGVELSGPLVIAPLMNIVLLARDLLANEAHAGTASLVVISTLLYAGAALGVAARVFGTEAVLTDQASGWGDLFTRPRTQRDAVPLSSALLCLALLFPANFLVANVLANFRDAPLAGRLLVMALANVVLFAGFPAVTAWWSRARPGPAFLLTPPRWGAVIAALLLGLCLWPLVHELSLLLRAAGFTSLTDKQREALAGFLGQWRTLPVALVVLSVGVIPPVVEELLFRGMLFRALSAGGRRWWAAVVVSAALFALFHLLVSDMLVIDRLPPSFLLGLVLGLIAWKTGSVVPGLVLHSVHNTTLALLGYYEPDIKAAGWVVGADDHVPLALLGPSLAVAALAGLWLWRGPGVRRPG